MNISIFQFMQLWKGNEIKEKEEKRDSDFCLVACANFLQKNKSRTKSSTATAFKNLSEPRVKKKQQNFYVFGSRICKWLIGWCCCVSLRCRQCWFSWNIYVRWKWIQKRKKKTRKKKNFRWDQRKLIFIKFSLLLLLSSLCVPCQKI